MEFGLAIIVVVLAVLAWSLNLFGAPGNWLIVAEMVLYATVVPESWRLEVSFWVLVVLVLLAAAGEGVEFLAGAWGATKAGGSKRSAGLAMIGSLVGGFLGFFVGVGIPIPVIGSVLGALLCASLGAFAGGLLGEQWKGRDLDASMRVGHAAFWGRFVGTVGKIVVGVMMILLVTASLVF